MASTDASGNENKHCFLEYAENGMMQCFSGTNGRKTYQT
jgi:hypothetical protein